MRDKIPIIFEVDKHAKFPWNYIDQTPGDEFIVYVEFPEGHRYSYVFSADPDSSKKLEKWFKDREFKNLRRPNGELEVRDGIQKFKGLSISYRKMKESLTIKTEDNTILETAQKILQQTNEQYQPSWMVKDGVEYCSQKEESKMKAKDLIERVANGENPEGVMGLSETSKPYIVETSRQWEVVSWHEDIEDALKEAYKRAKEKGVITRVRLGNKFVFTSDSKAFPI